MSPLLPRRDSQSLSTVGHHGTSGGLHPWVGALNHATAVLAGLAGAVLHRLLPSVFKSATFMLDGLSDSRQRYHVVVRGVRLWALAVAAAAVAAAYAAARLALWLAPRVKAAMASSMV